MGQSTGVSRSSSIGSSRSWRRKKFNLNVNSITAVSTTKVEGAKSQFQGTLTVLGGKGRYEEAKGDGSVTGARIVPLATGADLYNDLVINVKK